MNRFLVLSALMFFSHASFANGLDWTYQEREEEKEEIQKEQEVKEQRMEEPSSTAIGGSRSGDLEIERDQDQQMRQEAEKQKMLYEYENKYRRGL